MDASQTSSKKETRGTMSKLNGIPDEKTTHRLSSSTLETLDHLFHAAPPSELRENLIELYHSYLIRARDSLPVNFDQLSRNMYHLIHCLADINFKSND